MNTQLNRFSRPIFNKTPILRYKSSAIYNQKIKKSGISLKIV